jgi:hypothetical protein
VLVEWFLVSGLSAVLGVRQQKLCISHVGVQTNLCAANEQRCICLGCHKTCMPMRQSYWRSVAWLGPISNSHTIHHRHSLRLIVVFVLSLSCCPHVWSINILIWSHCPCLHIDLCHYCCCYCCRWLIDCHRVVALYSFYRKFVWDWSIFLLFLLSRRPFVFIVKMSIPLSIAILFLSWSCRCHRCGPIDRCFVLIVELYSLPTCLHHVRSIIRSCRLRVRACVFVVVVVDNTSSLFLFTFIRVIQYVVCSLNDIDITSMSGFLFTFVSVIRKYLR